MSSTIVLYHQNCPDGFGAAYAAWKLFGDTATYVPAQYGEAPPPDTIRGGGPDVYVLDFSYSRDWLELMKERCRSLLVLDHHKTAEAALSGLPYARFDMDKSGAVLAWEYFHPGKPLPRLLAHVQDRDLWRWKLDNSKEVSAALASYDRTFAFWDLLASELERGEGLDDFVKEGATILRYQSMQVRNACNAAFLTTIAGHEVPAVNSPVNQSEIGEQLCERFADAPFAAVFFCPSLEEEVWSLRSLNGFDVSEVAKALGGGGHKAAAGFKRKRGA
jgi:oligoribonuclease NrnB/cAMP/cGMP phosphodiesterase (DHH superfamily)